MATLVEFQVVEASVNGFICNSLPSRTESHPTTTCCILALASWDRRQYQNGNSHALNELFPLKKQQQTLKCL
jgi:hypothetical protein